MTFLFLRENEKSLFYVMDDDLKYFIRDIIDLIKIKNDYIDKIETMNITQLKL